MKGKIVAIPFPFTDLKGAKVRPALVIYEGHEDVIVAFISSKIPAELYNVHVLLTKEMPGFKLLGLKRDSVIRLNKLATIDKSLIEGEFGEIDSDLKKEVSSYEKEKASEQRAFLKRMEEDVQSEDQEWARF